MSYFHNRLLENEKVLIMFIIRDSEAASLGGFRRAWVPETTEKAGGQWPGAGQEQVDLRGSRDAIEKSEKTM